MWRRRLRLTELRFQLRRERVVLPRRVALRVEQGVRRAHPLRPSGPRVVNDQTRAEMRKILQEVQSGEFARQWIEENKTGRKKFLAMREAARNQPIEKVGRELREMMTFLKKKKETGVPEDQPALAARK